MGDLAGGDLQCGEQRGGAVAHVVVGAAARPARAAPAASAGCAPGPGAGTSRRRRPRRPCRAGSRYSPTTSRTLASSWGSVENLKVSSRHGRIPHLRQIAATWVKCSFTPPREQPRRPVRHPQLLGRRQQGVPQHLALDRDVHDPWAPGALGLLQAGQAALGVGGAPLGHRRLADADQLGDLQRRASLRSEQHDAGAARVTRRRGVGAQPPLELVAVPVVEGEDLGGRCHDAVSHARPVYQRNFNYANTRHLAGRSRWVRGEAWRCAR